MSGLAKRHLVMWDIDHTLIETRGFGSEMFRCAFESATGRSLSGGSAPAGQTELAIFIEASRRHGIEPNAALISRYRAVLNDQYTHHARVLRDRGVALPGATEALVSLARTPSLVQTVLTGNLQGVALLKLQTFGLDGYLDTESGAFGEDNLQRTKLVAFAQGRAGAKHGALFDASNSVLVGDTVEDVIAARTGGAAVVAVASGRDSAEMLRQAGADIVLPDLRNVVAAVRCLLRYESTTSELTSAHDD